MCGAAAPGKSGFVVVNSHRVEFNRTNQRVQAQRYPAFLPGIAQQHRVGINAVAHQLGGGQVGIEGADVLSAHGLGDLKLAGTAWICPRAVVHKRCRWRTVGVECHMCSTKLHAQHRFLVSRNDGVATNDQVCIGRAHPRGANVVRRVADEHMAPGTAAFLRQTRRVLRHDALAFNMRGHAQQLTDGDDACAAHACYDCAPDLASYQARNHRLRQRTQSERVGFRIGFRFLLELATLHRDKARTKSFDAGHVLVAGALVDLPLATEFSL